MNIILYSYSHSHSFTTKPEIMENLTSARVLGSCDKQCFMILDRKHYIYCYSDIVLSYYLQHFPSTYSITLLHIVFPYYLQHSHTKYLQYSHTNYLQYSHTTYNIQILPILFTYNLQSSHTTYSIHILPKVFTYYLQYSHTTYFTQYYLQYSHTTYSMHLI